MPSDYWQSIGYINIKNFAFRIDVFEKIFFLGSNNDLEQIKSILRNYEYSNKVNFEAIEANYDLREVPDKLIISKENELSNESKLLKHFLKNSSFFFVFMTKGRYCNCSFKYIGMAFAKGHNPMPNFSLSHFGKKTMY